MTSVWIVIQCYINPDLGRLVETPKMVFSTAEKAQEYAKKQQAEENIWIPESVLWYTVEQVAYECEEPL